MNRTFACSEDHGLRFATYGALSADSVKIKALLESLSDPRSMPDKPSEERMNGADTVKIEYYEEEII